MVPAEVRARQGWTTGTPLVLVEGETGVTFMTREQAKAHVRAQFRGSHAVDDLIAERRKAAQQEDAE
ncbi:hypothetical protein GCM10010921_30940 [Microbacterium album]|uniref:AbrB/MazE/SpoVT family DNA-binding domain-containing protein n=1 Tax=Microbacterium album TaxID=2053191 RepID=A0A917IJT7_9MICO|nr:hypothetical protein GCM10010921_30940 [Microbacterium album]